MKRIIFAVILILYFATTCFSYDFTLTIPDQHAITVRDALCEEWDYEENCLKNGGEECTESKKDFLERWLRRYIKNVVNNYRKWDAMQTAEMAVEEIEFD